MVEKLSPVPVESEGTNDIFLLLGFQARYETDQALEHSNGAFSLASTLVNQNFNYDNVLSWIPSVHLTVDAVFQDSNGTADTMGIETDDVYGRVHASADWLVRFDELLNIENGMALHVGLQYSYAFGDSKSLEMTGQDETFGALFELLIDNGPLLDLIGTIVPDDREGAGESGREFFVQYSTGHFTPLPEAENRLLAGYRFRF